MLKFYFMRHFAIDPNYHGLIYGAQDIALEKPITANRQEYQHTLSQCDLAFISPMVRARDSFEFLQLPITPIIIDDLREQNFGWLESKTWSDIATHFPEFHAAFWRNLVTHPIYQGESIKEFCQRVAYAMQYIMSIVQQKKSNHILVLSHAGTMRAVKAYLNHDIAQAMQYHWDYGEIMQCDVNPDVIS